MAFACRLLSKYIVHYGLDSAGERRDWLKASSIAAAEGAIASPESLRHQELQFPASISGERSRFRPTEGARPTRTFEDRGSRIAVSPMLAEISQVKGQRGHPVVLVPFLILSQLSSSLPGRRPFWAVRCPFGDRWRL